MKEYTLGDHASVFKGSGFNFVGIRDWQPGDRMSSIDWAQSSLTNFSPLVTREFEQDSNATDRRRRRRVAVDALRRRRRADRRGHRAVGRRRRPVGRVLPGSVRPDHVRRQLPPGGGGAAAHRQAARHLLPRPVPAAARPADPAAEQRDVTATIEGHLRKTSLVPVISDFLLRRRAAA